MLDYIVSAYIKIFPDERNDLAALIEQINSGEKLNDRKNFRGHIAGDGIVLSSDRSNFLLIRHKLFKAWMQPGGHWDPEDADPLAVAKRELKEETGLKDFELLEWGAPDKLVPIDITLDNVPVNPAKGEPKHIHYTFAYLFQAKSEKLKHREEEVAGAKWATFEEACEPRGSYGSHFPRIISKLKRFNIA